MKQTIPGVMLSIENCGVLLQGESGIGKSELALQLLDRGHQLVSDDAVTLHASGGQLIAQAPETLRGFLGVRNIGVINVVQHFGAGVLCPWQSVDLIITLTHAKQIDDPLPLSWPTQTLLGYTIANISLQQSSGRNLALLIETAVKQAQIGCLSTATFIQTAEQRQIL